MTRISIVIPTKDSISTLGRCLDSVARQTHKDHELIVVDAGSVDGTKELAEEYGTVFSLDSGRSEARNYGFSRASGDIFVSIDADMILEENLLEDISASMGDHGALVIPETGHGEGYLSACKDLEKRCYIGDGIVEAVRAFTRQAFAAVDGYDIGLLFGEDWDLHSRISASFTCGRTTAMIMHDTSGLTLRSLITKSYLYGRHLGRYLAKGNSQQGRWLDPRNILFIRHFGKLKREPAAALGLLALKSMEYAAGAAGYAVSRLMGR